MNMTFARLFLFHFIGEARIFFVSDHLLNSHDNNDNLGIILQGEISCLSLFGVKGSEKVYV